MSALPRPIKLYPREGSSLYADVYVLPTLRAMRAEIQTFEKTLTCVQGASLPMQTRHAQGVCYGIEARHTRSKRLSPLFSIIYLAQTNLGIGTVSHEVLHATFRYCGRIGIAGIMNLGFTRTVEDHRIEEIVAEAHDRMMRMLVYELYERKYYREVS